MTSIYLLKKFISPHMHTQTHTHPPDVLSSCSRHLIVSKWLGAWPPAGGTSGWLTVFFPIHPQVLAASCRQIENLLLKHAGVASVSWILTRSIAEFFPSLSYHQNVIFQLLSAGLSYYNSRIIIFMIKHEKIYSVRFQSW